MQKFAVIQFWNVAPHFETSLEIALKLSQLPDIDLMYCFWGEQILYNDCLLKADSKYSRQEKAYHLTSNLINWHFDSHLYTKKYFIDDFYLQSISHLKRLQVNNFPVGDYLLCALIDHTKIPAPLPSTFSSVLHVMYSTFLNVFYSCIDFLQDYSVDHLILFNGRHISYNACSCAARFLNVKTSFHERGGNNFRYLLLDKKVHSIEQWQSLMKETWKVKEVTDDEAYISTSKILQEKCDSHDSNKFAYRDQQKSGYVKLRDSSKLNISYFSSSIDENSMTTDKYLYPTGFWEDQRIAVLDLITTSLRISHDINVYLRLHPNLIRKEDELKLWLVFGDIFKENIILIMPDEPVDSYELAKCSDLNFVYHSSIGAEIMALGRHVYSLNSCRYDYLHGCTVVNDTHHMSQIIRANLLSKPQKFDSTISRNGLEYLYSASNFGEKFLHYKPESFLSGTFLGIHL